MKLRQLKFLLAIAESGTLTAAAESLFVSQSALSQQIKSLEEELGSPLF
ncbi:LysR family transcriptional regulator, partial [Candidatus Saccharibacteria bacterium]|nr:LysR family transcriptional regulator [Candidatus Saccharibacteria bacterium]NIW80796.1 LysR family transcriptional regulator [Calditrichia bacterium]